MVAPLSDVPQEGSSVFSLFSLIKLHLASLPLASSYSRVAVSSVFWAQNIFFSAQTRGAPLIVLHLLGIFFLREKSRLPGSNSRLNVSEGYEVTSELPGRPVL